MQFSSQKIEKEIIFSNRRVRRNTEFSIKDRYKINMPIEEKNSFPHRRQRKYSFPLGRSRRNYFLNIQETEEIKFSPIEEKKIITISSQKIEKKQFSPKKSVLEKKQLSHRRQRRNTVFQQKIKRKYIISDDKKYLYGIHQNLST